MDTPILLIVWRRPHTLHQVINAMRPVAPSCLYVACDGPSPERAGEAEKVSATRDVIEEEIDWPCHVMRLYSHVNQGCRLGVSRAITWFFEHVEEGIILEDDCVPHPDFFSYCASLLERYRHDMRVWCISGSNFQDGIWRGDGSYYFSRSFHSWGWATWRRCWQYYDANMTDLPALLDSCLLPSIFIDATERRYWISIWKRLFVSSIPDTWDYQWVFVRQINSGLTALPNRNLVNNVGFGDDATHTTHSTIKTQVENGLTPIQHPKFIVADVTADRYTHDHHYGGLYHRYPLSFLFKPALLIKHLIRASARSVSALFVP